MSAILPHDLINFSNTGASISTEGDHIDIVYERQQILHAFWNVHLVRYKVSRHVSDARCRNLFWRVWGSPTLSRSISTATLTTLWDRCQTEQELPPRARLSITAPDQYLDSGVHPNTSRHDRPRVSIEHLSDHGPEPAEHFNGDAQQSVRQDNAIGPRDEISPTFSIGSEEGPSSRPRPFRGSSSRSGNGRTPNTGRDRPMLKGRVRPTLGRRKSSQTAKSTKSTPGPDYEEVDELQEPKSSRGGAAVFALASPSSWEDEPATASSGLSPKVSPSNKAQLVIDKDFRGKFVEKIASSTNIVSMGRMKKTGSVVRFADQQLSSTGRERESLSTTFEHPIRPILSHRQSTSSVAISDDETDIGNAPRTGLHRTTSSLSMLIQQAHLDGKPLNLESSHNESGRLKSPKQQENTEEDELLAMGRRAGSVRLPPRKDGESGYSSPEPEPLF